MSSVAQFPTKDNMHLPDGQDVIIVPDSILLAWKTGPLPDPDLEQLARELFAFDRGTTPTWYQVFASTQDDYRRQILRMRVQFLQMDRWTLGNCVDKLTDESCQLLFGDRRLGSSLRKQIHDYAESYIEDLARLFATKLFYPREVEANQREIEQEDANG